LAEAIEVSNRLGPQGAQLADLAKATFVEAMQSSLLVMAVIVGVAAVLIGLWSPGRDGRQLRAVRRLTSIRRARSVGDTAPEARSTVVSRGQR
jgi:hypothetical protein